MEIKKGEGVLGRRYTLYGERTRRDPNQGLFDLLIESTVAELTLTVSQYMQAPPHSDMHFQSFSLAQTSHICVK